MKSYFPNPFNIILVLIVIFLFASIAEAGIFDRFQNVAIGKIIDAGIAALFFILAAVFGAKILKYKKVVKEGKDFAMWVYDSTRPDSPGGAQITGDEIEKGIKEAGEFGIAVMGAVASHKTE